jgi:hypothetical protein
VFAGSVHIRVAISVGLSPRKEFANCSAKPFMLHDLRRTAATLAGDLRKMPQIMQRARSQSRSHRPLPAKEMIGRFGSGYCANRRQLSCISR